MHLCQLTTNHPFIWINWSVHCFILLFAAVVQSLKSCPTLLHALDYSSRVPLSMGFPRQDYWSGLPFPSPGDFPDPRIEPTSPAWQTIYSTTEPLGKPACPSIARFLHVFQCDKLMFQKKIKQWEETLGQRFTIKTLKMSRDLKVKNPLSFLTLKTNFLGKQDKYLQDFLAYKWDSRVFWTDLSLQLREKVSFWFCHKTTVWLFDTKLIFLLFLGSQFFLIGSM